MSSTTAPTRNTTGGHRTGHRSRARSSTSPSAPVRSWRPAPTCMATAPPTDSWVESLPLAATGAKGRVRAQMWIDAKALHDAGRIRATEVRGSDYIWPAEQSLDRLARVVPRILAGRKVSVVGSADAEHSWTSPADAARLLVAVAAHERGWGSAWHVPSNPPRTQRQVVDDLADAAGVERVPVASLSPGMMRIAGAFSPAIRELAETAYQRDRPFIVDDMAVRPSGSSRRPGRRSSTRSSPTTARAQAWPRPLLRSPRCRPSKSEPMVALTSSLGEPSIQLCNCSSLGLRQGARWPPQFDLLRWCAPRPRRRRHATG
jgi:hypothetical protein